MKKHTLLLLSASFGVVFYHHAAWADYDPNEIIQCRQIDDSLARLNCYDELEIDEDRPTETVESIIENLKRLIEYNVPDVAAGPWSYEANLRVGFEERDWFERTGPDRHVDWSKKPKLIHKGVNVNGCSFTSRRVYVFAAGEQVKVSGEWLTDNYRTADRIVREEARFVGLPEAPPSRSYFWSVDLQNIDLNKSKHGELVMYRGFEFRNETVVDAWSVPRFVVDARGLDPASVPDYQARSVKNSLSRSGSVSLGLAYPEDRSEIWDRFFDLARACSQED